MKLDLPLSIVLIFVELILSSSVSFIEGQKFFASYNNHLLPHICDYPRVKYYRNSVYGHASQASVDNPTFNFLWQGVSATLVVLGVDAAAIRKLKTETMDPDTVKHYRELLKEWKKDENNIKDQLDRMKAIN